MNWKMKRKLTFIDTPYISNRYHLCWIVIFDTYRKNCNVARQMIVQMLILLEKCVKSLVKDNICKFFWNITIKTSNFTTQSINIRLKNSIFYRWFSIELPSLFLYAQFYKNSTQHFCTYRKEKPVLATPSTDTYTTTHIYLLLWIKKILHLFQVS